MSKLKLIALIGVILLGSSCWAVTSGNAYEGSVSDCPDGSFMGRINFLAVGIANKPTWVAISVVKDNDNTAPISQPWYANNPNVDTDSGKAMLALEMMAYSMGNRVRVVCDGKYITQLHLVPDGYKT